MSYAIFTEDGIDPQSMSNLPQKPVYETKLICLWIQCSVKTSTLSVVENPKQSTDFHWENHKQPIQRWFNIVKHFYSHLFVFLHKSTKSEKYSDLSQTLKGYYSVLWFFEIFTEERYPWLLFFSRIN